MIELKLSNLTTDQMRTIADILDEQASKDNEYKAYVAANPGDKVYNDGVDHISYSGNFEADQHYKDIKSTTAPEVITDSQQIAAAFEAGQKAEDAGSIFAEHPVETIAPPAVETIAPPSEQLAKSTTGQMIPWDERIHAGSKNTNADGSWRLKPGVDRTTYVPQIEAELSGSGETVVEQPAATITPPPVVEQPAATITPPPVVEQPAATIAPPPVVEQPAATIAPPPVVEGITTFPVLLQKVMAAKTANTLNDATIDEILKGMGLTLFGQLAVKTDLIPAFAAACGLQ